MLLLGRYAKGMNLCGWPLAGAALLADLGVTEEGGSMANLLDATIIADRGNTIVELHGDIDIASRPELRKLFDDLGDQENERILVSLAQCTYCDSTVLNALVALKKRVTSP